MRRAAAVLLLLLLGAGTVARTASAETTPPVIERTAVRFVAPETGGAEHPRFVFERFLAFEARLELMTTNPTGIGDGYTDRDVRSALEHDVAQQMLASLAQKLIADSPADRRPPPAEVEAAMKSVSAAYVTRLGSRARIDEAAAAERIEPYEVDGLLHRAAFAAWYIDRTLTPLLHPTDEQLRNVHRQASNPFHAQRYDQVHDALAQWFTVDRILVAESAFLQSSRSHVRIVVTK